MCGENALCHSNVCRCPNMVYGNGYASCKGDFILWNSVCGYEQSIQCVYTEFILRMVYSHETIMFNKVFLFS